jgi:hypothetical protein
MQDAVGRACGIHGCDEKPIKNVGWETRREEEYYFLGYNAM